MARRDKPTEADIFRALVVDEFGSVSWDEYIRQQSRMDDGRNPAGN